MAKFGSNPENRFIMDPVMDTSFFDPKTQRMPSWTNFRNTETFSRLQEILRKEAQWDSTELLLLEFLARFTKTASVSAKLFFQAVPEKYLQHVHPSERFGTVLAFLEKLSAVRLCQVVFRSDEGNQIERIQLVDPAGESAAWLAGGQTSPTGQAAIESALAWLHPYYRRRDFKSLLADVHAHLPGPDMLAKRVGIEAQVFLETCAERLPSMVFSTRDTVNPLPRFIQEGFVPGGKPFTVLDFPSLSRAESDSKPGGEAFGDEPENPFSLVLPSDTVIKDFARDFFVPFILAYLQDDKNKDVYRTIHHEWAKKIHTSIADAKLDPDARIENVLLAADINDGAYFASVHVLTNVLRHLRLRDLPSAPSPAVYEAARFVYDHAIACRQLVNLEKAREAERARDQELVIDFLLRGVYQTPADATISGPMPVELKRIEDLPDCGGQVPLGVKYRSVKELIPVATSNVDLVPRVLMTDGRYLHRWQLVNYFVLMQHLESKRVQQRLAAWWAQTAIPRLRAAEVPPAMVSRDFMRAVDLVHEYRSGARMALDERQIGRELEVFVHYFFPGREEARVHKIENLLKASADEEDNTRGPKAIVRDAIDQVLYRSPVGYSLQPYTKMVYFDYPTVRQAAAARVKQQVGLLGYLLFLIKGFLGLQPQIPPPPADPRLEPARPAPEPEHATVAALRPKPVPLDPKLAKELESVLETLPRVLRIELSVVQDIVEPLVKHYNPDIRALSDDEAKLYVKGFIARSPKLNSLPFRADPLFARYLLLMLRKNNAQG